MLDVSVGRCQNKGMKGTGRKQKLMGKVIREKRPAAKPAQRPQAVPLPAAWER